MRYGEADRILHLYTPDRGRVSAIAKGVRRARSRFGGRLEPFFRLRIELHEGRSELLTVTGAHTLDGPRAPARQCRGARPRRARVRRGRAAVRDLRAPSGRSTPVPKAVPAGPAAAGSARQRGDALAFRLKLLLAAGLAPELGAAHLRRARAPGRLLRGGGRVVCGACEAGVSRSTSRPRLHDRGARPPAEQYARAPATGARPGRAGDLRDARASCAPAADAGRGSRCRAAPAIA